jgi:inositol oxygenase
MRHELAFADKEISKFRDYSVDTTDPLKERVRYTYRQMHLNQTVDFVKGKPIEMRFGGCFFKIRRYFLSK